MVARHLVSIVEISGGSLHTSQISHLLLYPSLSLLVPEMSSQFLPLFPISETVSIIGESIVGGSTVLGWRLRRVLPPFQKYFGEGGGRLQPPQLPWFLCLWLVTERKQQLFFDCYCNLFVYVGLGSHQKSLRGHKIQNLSRQECLQTP